jgi:hypothetical protein
LTSSIPKSKLDVLAINLNVGDVVLEDGGDVDLVAKTVSTCFWMQMQLGRCRSQYMFDLGVVACNRGIGRSGGFGGPIKGPDDGGRGGVSPQGRYPWRRHCEQRLVRDRNVKEKSKGKEGIFDNSDVSR